MRGPRQPKEHDEIRRPRFKPIKLTAEDLLRKLEIPFNKFPEFLKIVRAARNSHRQRLLGYRCMATARRGKNGHFARKTD